VPVLEHWPDIPRPLAQLLVAMLAKDPAQRPPLAQIAQTLDAAIAKPRRPWLVRTVIARASAAATIVP
jgi:hypothetical protein